MNPIHPTMLKLWGDFLLIPQTYYMRHLILSHLLMVACIATALGQGRDDNPTPPHVKTINFEFMAGYLATPVVGVEAKMMRDAIRDAEDADPDFKGSVLPKSSAYVGILVDYRFHRLVGIGTGIVYTPKGYWNFTKNDDFDFKRKAFYTVDYFEFPLFLQIYAHPKVWFRAGPVFSFAGITKVRIITMDGDDKEKEKYRFGENGSPRAKEFVPGLEAAVNFGNPSGFHGTFGVQYSGTMYEDIDVKPIMFRLGFGYTLTK